MTRKNRSRSGLGSLNSELPPQTDMWRRTLPLAPPPRPFCEFLRVLWLEGQLQTWGHQANELHYRVSSSFPIGCADVESEPTAWILHFRLVILTKTLCRTWLTGVLTVIREQIRGVLKKCNWAACSLWLTHLENRFQLRPTSISVWIKL
jgi:hypothetical protein